MNLSRFRIVIWKEIRHIIRDPLSLRIAILMPILFTFLFGYAITTDIEHIRFAVYDGDKTYESRELIRKFAASTFFTLETMTDQPKELDALIDSGTVKAGLIIPSGYSRALKRGKQPETLLIIDGTDPTIARTALQSGNLIANVYTMTSLTGRQIDVSAMKTRVWYNPNLESSKFIIPGLIGLIMQNITIMLTAFALVREKEKGTIEQLIVTPLKPIELILGKLVPYVFIGTVDFLIALFFGTWYFDVAIQGNLFLLFALGLLFVISALAIGMMISSVTQNQVQAMQLSFIIILPAVLLSGFMFPRDSMPILIYWLGNLIPLTYFLEILRGIILKGIGMEYLWKEVLSVLFIGLGLLTAAVKHFHKSLD